MHGDDPCQIYSVDKCQKKYLPMDQTENTELNKLSGGECSQAGHSTKQATNSQTERFLQINKSTRSDYNDKDVFLSHSGKQKPFVKQLYRDLTNQGLSCFFDKDRDSLPLAENFPTIIFEAVKTCKVAVLLLSKEFLESKWPMQELAAFVEAKNATDENPKPKILPFFFHIRPEALKEEDVCKEKWKQLGISDDTQTQWLKALQAIRPINGINFRDGEDEVEFREEIVKEIWRILPPSQRYHIPHMQGGERMCQEVTNFLENVRPNKKRILIAGLYGIAGHGKTSLGKAFCNFKLRDFEGKVCHLEFSRGNPFERVKLALQYLTHCSLSNLHTLTDPDQAKAELYKRMKGKRVLLVLDNITEENMDEVSYYINAELGEKSCILLSARSVDLLVNHFRIDSPSCMHVPILEDDEAIGILLESTSLEVSTLGAEDRASASKCVNRCSFSCDTDRRRPIFHPLALKTFGRHLYSKYGENLSKWVTEVDGLVDPSGYGLDTVFAVLSEAFKGLLPEYRTIFMLLTVYMLPSMSPHEVTEWLAIICNEDIIFINKAVEDLRKKAFLEEFEPEIRIHGLYFEFAQSAANEMRKWLWWKGDRSSTRQLISKDQDGFELAKLEQCMDRRPSQIAPKYLKNLWLIQLVAVSNMSKLDFRQMDSLRSITLQNCKDLRELEGMEFLAYLAWLRISEVNPMFKLPKLSSLEGLQHLEIDIEVTQVLDQLSDLTSCSNLKEINVRCPSLPEFPRLNGLRHLKKVEFSVRGKVKEPLDCTNCVMLESIVLKQCRQMATPPVLAGCNKLDKIILSECDAVTAWPDIDVPCALKTLELSISSKAASAPRSLESCDKLENLHLWNMVELKELPSFKRLSNLTVLKIGKCGIREPPDLACCLKLENVYFFTLKNLERFPKFSLLSELKILNLYNCRRVQDPPHISGCHKLQVFHLFHNDNMEGLPKMHECPELDEIKVSWHCEDEVTYEGIVPDSCEVDDSFQSCEGNLNDACVPIELREWLLMQEKRWMDGRTLLAKKYFRGAKLYCTVMASYELYESLRYYSKSYITLRSVDGKVIVFPTPGRVCKDRYWLNKVRKYFAEIDDIASASSVTECEDAEGISLPLPMYRVPPMQGEARMCQEVAKLFDTVHSNEEENNSWQGVCIAGLYGMRGVGKTTLGKAFCNSNLGNYEGRVLHIEFGADHPSDTQKLALQHLTRSRNSQFEWVTGEDDVRYFFRTKVEGQRVLLVLDNISEDSIDKVRDYLAAELGEESRILLIARSVNVLENFINSKSCMRIPELEDEEALTILMERTSIKVSALEAEDRRLAMECAQSCLLKEGGDFAPRFHPVALKALGRHCFSKHDLDLSKWVAERDGFTNRVSRDLDVVFAVLGIAFDDMDPSSRSIFMLLALLMPPKLSSDEIIKWIAEICKEEVENLYNKGFIEELEPEIRINHLMEEFAEKLQRRQLQDDESPLFPPRYHSQRYSVQPNKYQHPALSPRYSVPPTQGEARMCQELEDFLNNVQSNEKGIRVVGLYGLPGQGKPPLARLERQKHALHYLTSYCFTSHEKELNSLNEDEAQVEFYENVKGERVLLVLDNIEIDESVGEVTDYLGAEFGGGSYILLIARSVDVLLKNDFNITSESCMGMPSLTEEEATLILLETACLELSCQYAFGIQTNPTDPHLDKELVQAECIAFPLAVQEIVSSNYQKEGLFNRLKTSIHALNDDERECFLDLAAFPEGESVPANALLDIWVYVRGMTRDKAVMLLLKFAVRHLLHLMRHTRLPSIRDDCLNSCTLFQDDVQRKLALFLVKIYNRVHFRRMYVSREESEFYPKMQKDKYQSSEAQIVSFDNGAMTYMEEWPQMHFPEAEALILYIANRYEYSLPPFLFKMEKLKVLMIHNDYGGRPKLIGMDNFQLPSQLQSLHLEMLNVPSLLEHCNALERLKKIRFCQCEGLRRYTTLNFPGLLECYVESCIDLRDVPAGICSSKSLEVLSIAECGSFTLPEELDKLESLKEIRLCECFSLEPLPPSICNLTRLEILDISGGYVYHEEEQSLLKETLQKLAKIPSLRCVICDNRIKKQFESSFGPGLLKFVVL